MLELDKAINNWMQSLKKSLVTKDYHVLELENLINKFLELGYSKEDAFKQPIRFGRLNPEYYEVLSGLEPGDKVITSSYDTFGDNEVLYLE